MAAICVGLEVVDQVELTARLICDGFHLVLTEDVHTEEPAAPQVDVGWLPVRVQHHRRLARRPADDAVQSVAILNRHLDPPTGQIAFDECLDTLARRPIVR
jgi:hypothetical protein